MPLTSEQAAYVAGIIDGEGSIFLTRSFAKRTRGRYVYPVVKVANTDPLLIEWLYAVVGTGSVRYASRMNERCKDVVHIGWVANQAVDLLRQVLPYLVIKRDRARLVMHLCEETERAKAEAGGPFGHGRPLPDWLVELRESTLAELSAANRRGI